MAQNRSRIVVFGDAMLDRYIEGRVDRLSPEAPVPILLRGDETVFPGGAANVAINIIAQQGKADLFAVTGVDAAGESLGRALQKGEVDDQTLAIVSQSTTEKTRFTCQGKHLLRVDAEVSLEVAMKDLAPLFAALRETLPKTDAVVISDYGKGLLTEPVLHRVLAAAQTHGVPTIADPKGSDFSKYRGVDVLTPNASELAQATNCKPDNFASLASAAEQVRRDFDIGALVVTRGAKGLMVVSATGVEDIRGRAYEVFEVSGAGDTVVATLAVALAEGKSLTEAATRANIAGGLAVSRPGTVAPTKGEIEAEGHQLSGAKLVKRGTDFAALKQAWRAEGVKVGFTNGCFDLLHLGHVQLLRYARAHCDRLIVGLNSDTSVRRLKGIERPYQDETVRAAVLSALDCVGGVLIFDEDTPESLIQEVSPDVLFKGADYLRDQVVGGDFVESYGGEVLLVPLVSGYSTTATAKRIYDRHATAAE